MDKQSFLTLCGETMKAMGFVKKRNAYCLTGNNGVSGAVFFQKSSFGMVYYLNCTLTIQGYNKDYPYPKYHDTDIKSRIPFPLKVKLSYMPEATVGYSVDLERNTEDEVREYLSSGINDWMLPALDGGLPYLLEHWDKYRSFWRSEEVYAALTAWRDTGIMPKKMENQE